MRYLSRSPGNNKKMIATAKPNKTRDKTTRFIQRKDKQAMAGSLTITAV